MYKAARSSQEVSVKNEFTAAAAVLRKYHSSDDKQICNAPIQHSLLSSYLVQTRRWGKKGYLYCPDGSNAQSQKEVNSDIHGI